MPTRRSRQGAPALPVLPDSVDEVVLGWHQELPELPVEPIHIFVRLARLRARFDQELSDLFERYDLSSADFAVVAALRRSGEPYELPQSMLMQRLGLSSGTVSVRLARLQDKGVLAKSAHPTDARGSLVRLTDRGIELFAEVAPVHLANEELLLSALNSEEREVLVILLRKLLVSFEHPRVEIPLLGFSVAPAHEGRRARQLVGLSDVAGLLVLDVSMPSAAQAAGLRQGDLLVAVDDLPLTSSVALLEHMEAAASGRRAAALTVLRDTRRRTITF